MIYPAKGKQYHIFKLFTTWYPTTSTEQISVSFTCSFEFRSAWHWHWSAYCSLPGSFRWSKDWWELILGGCLVCHSSREGDNNWTYWFKKHSDNFNMLLGISAFSWVGHKEKQKTSLRAWEQINLISTDRWLSLSPIEAVPVPCLSRLFQIQNSGSILGAGSHPLTSFSTNLSYKQVWC